MRWNHFSTLGSLVFAAANAVAGAGQGLRVDDADQLGWPRWQARLQVFSEPVTRGVTSFDGGSLRPRSAALFGDYYMTRAYLGQAGGVRLTGGLLTGTRGTVIAPGLATPQGLFGIGTAQTGLGPTPFGVISETQTWPYVGIGYSESSPRGGWGFSADFGLAAQQFSLAARSLGNRSLDGAVREMRLTPVLQLGLAYRF
ncbi:MAG: hypothetical protein LKCHEGNO_01818 [Burkholderiaceae bacterium]|nr:hypothetical protein [Burkholderiaceae bacterium]